MAGAILEILQAEADYPPLSAEKLAECLRVTGRPATMQEIEAAADELMQGGQVERVWRAGRSCYRALRSDPARIAT